VPLGAGVLALVANRLLTCVAGACAAPLSAADGPRGGVALVGTTPSGGVWAATSAGVEIRSASGRWRSRYALRLPEAIPSAYAVGPDGDEVLVTAAAKTGAAVQSARGGGPWRTVAPRASMTPQSADVGARGLAAVSFTSLEVLLRDGGTWRWLQVPAPVGSIRVVRFGAAGDLWVGGDGGLFLFRSASHLWSYRRYPAGDPRNTVNEVLRRRDGSVWVGTGQGIVALAKDGGEVWTRRAAGLPLPSVTALAEDDGGNVWVGTGTAAIGALRWDGRGWRRYGMREGLGAATIHRIARDRRGRLWFLGLGVGWPGMHATASGPGAYVLAEGRFTRWGVPEGLSSGRVYAFAEGPDSALWFATLGGIDRYRGGAWRHWTVADGLRISRVFTLAVGSDGQVWFGHKMSASGLGHIDGAGRVTYLSERDGLPSANISEVRVAPDGAAWATTPSGLARCVGRECAAIQMDDGLPSLQLWPVLPTATKVFVGALGTGLATIDLAEARRYDARVTQLVARLEGRGVATVEWQASSRLGWPAPASVETRVRLDEGAWSLWSTNRSLRFESLGAGRHRAAVEARSWLGDPSGRAVVAFDVPRPLLRRPEVLGPLVGLALLLTGLAWLLVDQRRRSRAERRAADALRRRLVAAMEQASDGFAVLDRAGVVEFANPAFEAITGWRAPGLVGRSVEQLAALAPRTGLLPEVAEAIRRGEAWEGDAPAQRSDGTPCRCFERITPLRDAAGEVANLVWLVRDVTRESELEEQALQAGRLEAVGQLSGGIAHDFNNLLAVVLANASLLEPEIRGGGLESRRSLEDIIAAAQHGAELVSSLLAFGRRRRLLIRPVDVAPLLEGLRAPIRRLLPDTVAIEIEVTEGLSAVRADEAALRQILLSLVSNSRDAMPHGGTLRVSAAPAGPPQRDGGSAPRLPDVAYVCITVTDTGTGMDAATLARAFEPFFTTKPPGAGTGLGLSSVYGLVHQQRGEVELESTLGAGATVRLVLPASSEKAVAPRSPEARAERAPSAGTILLVEDTAPMRRAAQLVLSRLGFKVLVAADGEEGLAAFRANAGAIELVVTDIVMPRLDGIGLFDAVRGEGSRVPFIFMSGYPASEAASGRSLDPSAPFLKKPWTADALAACVRQALAGAAPPRPSEPA
jgi:PAS domain S-box-containing protein